MWVSFRLVGVHGVIGDSDSGMWGLGYGYGRVGVCVVGLSVVLKLCVKVVVGCVGSKLLDGLLLLPSSKPFSLSGLLLLPSAKITCWVIAAAICQTFPLSGLLLLPFVNIISLAAPCCCHQYSLL